MAERFLGGSNRRAIVRPTEDIEMCLAGVSKHDREDLFVLELQKLKSKAEAGLESKVCDDGAID
jgi:hypothetical protein